MDLVRNLTGLIQAAYWLRTTRQIDHVGDPYGPHGTRRIHLRVLASMWPKYTRAPIDCPYSSDRKRVISYGLPTGYRSVRLSRPHLETEGLAYVQKTAA